MDDKDGRSGTLEDEEVSGTEAAQQNMGSQGSAGGGEFPDPDTPPRGRAPGTADPEAGPQEHGPGPSRTSGVESERPLREVQDRTTEHD